MNYTRPTKVFYYTVIPRSSKYQVNSIWHGIGKDLIFNTSFLNICCSEKAAKSVKRCLKQRVGGTLNVIIICIDGSIFTTYLLHSNTINLSEHSVNCETIQR